MFLWVKMFSSIGAKERITSRAPRKVPNYFFDNYPQPLNLTLTDGIEFVSSEGSATFNNNINTVSGTPYDDQIIGDSNYQGFIQSAGSDTVTAGGGKTGSILEVRLLQ